MASFKNIIFDLGGVLLNIDYNLTKEAFRALGFEHFEQMYNQYAGDELFDELEMGKVTPDEFIATMISRHGNGITAEQVTHAWEAMLLDFRTSSLAHLEKLAKKYNIYLLSNTNAIHLAAFNKILLAETGHEKLDDFFIKAYYSHKVGLRKPNRDIFEFVLKDAGIKAEETLFIDDSYNHIATAEGLGLQVHLLQKGERIEDVVPE
jgi:putative hydrolase of the HAD superfamily